MNEKIKTIRVSEIDRLHSFDIVRLIDDETLEFRGYFLNPEYHNIVKNIVEQENRDKNK